MRNAVAPEGQTMQRGQTAVPYEPVEPGVRPENAMEAEKSGPDEEWSFWSRQIKTAVGANERRWRQEATESERLYFGPDNDPGDGDSTGAVMENRIGDDVAMVHANIEVLKPLIYSETPKPIVRRRFRGDGKVDAAGRACVEVAQRLTEYLLDTVDFDGAMIGARDDWLIAGRGVGRVYYRAEFNGDAKASETVVPRALPWRRVAFPSGGWHTLPWMAFEIPMTRTQVEKRFGRDVAGAFSYNTKGLQDRDRGISDEDHDRGGLSAEDETGTPSESPFDTATVWEIWVRDTREVIWWSPDYKASVIDRDSDPLLLAGFWPMPKPLLATTKGDSLTPRPDIRYYERRAKEVGKAAEKLKSLLEVISVSALVPGELTAEIGEILKGKNTIKGVANWMSLLEKGGTQNIIQWLPLQAIMAAAQALVTLREQAKAAMFEASGVSDVMRAQGDPNATATQEQIKGRYAGLRLADRQRRMALFALDMIRLMVDVATEFFDTETIAEIAQLDYPMTEAERQEIIAAYEHAQARYAATMEAYEAMQAMPPEEVAAALGGQPMPPPPEAPPEVDLPETSWEAIHARLRSDIHRSITMTIETQSTVLADEQADKEARIEFVTAISEMAQRLMPMAMQGLVDFKTMKELLLFAVRGFPKSRVIEGMIAELPDEPPQAESEPAPDPQVIVAQIRAEVDKMVEEMRMADRQAERDHETELTKLKMGTEGARFLLDKATTHAPAQQPGA